MRSGKPLDSYLNRETPHVFIQVHFQTLSFHSTSTYSFRISFRSPFFAMYFSCLRRSFICFLLTFHLHIKSTLFQSFSFRRPGKDELALLQFCLTFWSIYLGA